MSLVPWTILSKILCVVWWNHSVLYYKREDAQPSFCSFHLCMGVRDHHSHNQLFLKEKVKENAAPPSTSFFSNATQLPNNNNKTVKLNKQSGAKKDERK